MRFRVYTYGNPLVIVLCLDSNSGVDASIRGYHPTQANTDFFNLRVDKQTIKELNGKIAINCPMVPENFVMVELSGPNLTGIETMPLPARNLYLPPLDKEYLEVAEWFAYNVGVLPPGTYKRGQFTIELFDKIMENGQVVPTPARMDHETGIPQVCKSDFDKYSVPIRVDILEHEWVHYRKDTTSEQEADFNGLNVCLARGYPKMELVYASTKIFGNDSQSVKRASANVDFINNWR